MIQRKGDKTLEMKYMNSEKTNYFMRKNEL